jgi:alcohol dehydrogenase (NADP+)
VGRVDSFGDPNERVHPVVNWRAWRLALVVVHAEDEDDVKRRGPLSWGAMESLVDSGRCRAIGLSDISLNELLPIYESARIKPAVVQIEAHPYLPETELLEFCKQKDIVFLAFAPLGHGLRPGPLEDPVISATAARVGKTPAQVLLAWAVQRGTALLTTPRTAARARENFNISALPEDALDEINRIQTRQRFNEVVKTGSPGFIPQGR